MESLGIIYEMVMFKEVRGSLTYTEENRPQGGLTFRKDTRVYHREGPA